MTRMVTAVQAQFSAAMAAGVRHGHRQNVASVNTGAIPDAAKGEFGAAATLSLYGNS